MDAVRTAGLEVELTPGEGAFYGPKLEFVLRDAIGRDWQCGTFQVDFVLPERLNASYVDESGGKRRPVMLHRAILGSFERFIGVLIEHYAGRFPLWLAPVQAVVATITGDADGYARQVFERLRAAGLRAELDLRNEKIGFKVREHSVAKVPVLLVVGRREAGAGNGRIAPARLAAARNTCSCRLDTYPVGRSGGPQPGPLASKKETVHSSIHVYSAAQEGRAARE